MIAKKTTSIRTRSLKPKDVIVVLPANSPFSTWRLESLLCLEDLFSLRFCPVFATVPDLPEDF